MRSMSQHPMLRMLVSSSRGFERRAGIRGLSRAATKQEEVLSCYRNHAAAAQSLYNCDPIRMNLQTPLVQEVVLEGLLVTQNRALVRMQYISCLGRSTGEDSTPKPHYNSNPYKIFQDSLQQPQYRGMILWFSPKPEILNP